MSKKSGSEKLYITHYYYPGTEPVVLTKDMLLDRIKEFNGSLDDFLKGSLVGCAYVEVQLWTGAERDK